MHWKSLEWMLLLAAGIAGCSSTDARQPDVAVHAPQCSAADGASQAHSAAPANFQAASRQPPCAVQSFVPPSPPSARVIRCVSDEEPIAPGVKQSPAIRPLRLEVPQDVPGAQAPAISLPRFDAANPQPRQRAVAELFPDLPPLGAEFIPQVRPGQPGLSLTDRESIAREHSPAIRQAAANVRAAMGAAVQAGLYPNPNLGYEADNINTGRTAGYQGAFFEHLATSVSAYITTLGSLWTAVVDLAALLEADDLARMGEAESVPPVPDLEEIAPLPCCHPTPLWQNRLIQTGDGHWAPAGGK